MSIRQGSKIIAGMPDVSGKADKATTYTKDEVDNLIQNIDALPNQADNSGKFLTTDGTQASWSELPDITMNGWNIFDHKFSDHLLNDPSWVRSDTYSWQDGGIYFTAYEELEKEFNSNTELSTDTYGEISINYYKSANGLKICLQDQSDAIEQLYANTGVAWYYIIDTENKRFKLPRSKWNFVGSRGNVGDYVDESLPNITGQGFWIHSTVEGSYTGALYIDKNDSGEYNKNQNVINDGGEDYSPVHFDASRSSSTYQDNAPVQQRATEMYLYFFMGDTLRDARIIDVNAVVENQTNVINELDALKNLLATIDYVVESKVATEEDPSWYRVYKSGWVEQGGRVDVNNTTVTITLTYQMADAGYYCNCRSITENSFASTASMENTTATTVTVRSGNNCTWTWEVKGQGA